MRLLIFLVILSLTGSIRSHWQRYTTAYDAAGELDYYQHSNYLQGDKAGYLPSDEQVHAVRGYQFIIQFSDPEKTLHDHPLLGTYLVGLSILLFDNPVVLSLFAGLLILFLVYQLAKIVTRDTNLAWLAVLIVSLEPLFIEQIGTSLLDIYLLLFSLAAIVTYLKWRQTDNSWFLVGSQLCLGFAFSTKFFLTSLPLFVALFGATLLSGNFKLFLRHVLSLPLVILAYLLGHFSYFYFHPSLLQFARYQRYLISWWAGTPTIQPFGVWSLIFQNRWQTWWGTREVIAAPGWWLGWPVLVGGGLLSLPILIIRKLRTVGIIPLYIFLVLNLALFSLSLVFPRYLLLILPICLVLCLYTVKSAHSGSGL